MAADHHRSHIRGQEGAVGLSDGIRESAQCWRELLLDVKRRGLSTGTKLVSADGELGFWQTVKDVWPRRASSAAGCTRSPTSSTNRRTTSNQKPSVRCRESGWARPRRWACRLPRLRRDLERQIRKAVECLIKYRDALLGFYDFPVEHWKHLRTTDEMASNF
jgi:putative transposase